MKRGALGTIAGIFCILGMITLGGCSSTVEPGVTTSFGTVYAQVSGKPESVVKATQQALKDMNLILISGNASQLSGKVIARTSEDKPITVNVQNRDNRVSELSIKVGGYGDEKMGLAILRNIQENLSKTEAASGESKGQASRMSPAERGAMLGLQN